MRIKNLPSIESMDGSQDALVIEQTDGSEDKSRKVSPAQIKQYVLGEVDEVPTEDSDNLVKSGGIFSTMAVPKYDATNRREYYEGGSAFDGNIDSVPTAGSNNAVSSGGTKTYVDNAIKYIDVTVNASTSGHEMPIRSEGGAYYEPLATHAALGVPRDKVLNISLRNWAGITKPFILNLGTSTVSAMIDSNTSIYSSDVSHLVLRVVYKN